MVTPPPQIGEFKIEKTLDGAIRLSIGGTSCILPPGDAIKAATAILTSCGVMVKFSTPVSGVIIPAKVLPS